MIFCYSNTKITEVTSPYGSEIEFEAVVDNYPDVSGNSQNFYIKTLDPKAKIYVTTSRYPEYRYGDRLKIAGEIERPENFSNFDWISYLKRFGVNVEIRNPEIEVIGRNQGNKILATLYKVRDKFESSVIKSLPEPESSLASGLLIGSKRGFSQSLLNDFSKVGITHIVALSGFNVTIIIIFITDLMLGYVEKKKIFLISIFLIVGFIAMTGAAPSVIRAAIITLLISYGKTIGRKADMTNLILLSAGVMVAANPFILRFDVGFQLSFLAFIGLIYFSPIIAKFFDNKYFKHWPGPIKSGVIETFSAQIFVLPIILRTFGLVSIIAPVSNIIILPLIPITMLFIFLSTLIYWVLPQIGQLAFLISYLPLKYIITIAESFAKLPISALQIPDHWQTAIVITYVLLVSAIIIKFRKVYGPQTS